MKLIFQNQEIELESNIDSSEEKYDYLQKEELEKTIDLSSTIKEIKGGENDTCK